MSLLKIAQLISDKEIQSWKDNDNILIEAGTGRGKTYFIQTKLSKYAREYNKKILFLVHRLSLFEQFLFDITNKGVTQTIEVRTYQSIEHQKEYLDYDFIVCDEFHYFVGDSTMNLNTIKSFTKILGSRGIKIYMSATPGTIVEYYQEELGLEIKRYYLEGDYEYIRSLVFYYGINDIKEIIESRLNLGKKVMLFTTFGNRRIESLYEEFEEDAMVYVSKSNSLYHLVDERLIDELIQTRKLPRNLLIATSVMDAGVSIEDVDADTIILDVKEDYTFTQCLGRRRVYEGEEIDVYVNILNRNTLEQIGNKYNYDLEKCLCFEQEGLQEYEERYGIIDRRTFPVRLEVDLAAGKSEILYNPFYRIKCKEEVERVSTLIFDTEAETRKAYISHVCNLLKRNPFNHTIKPRSMKRYTNKKENNANPKEELQEFLEEKIDQEITEEDLETIGSLLSSIKRKSKPSQKTIRKYLKDDYNLKLIRKSKREKGEVIKVNILTEI